MTTTKPAAGIDFHGGVVPDPHEHAWLGFTLDEREEVAAATFQQRYGRPPEFVFESRGNLLVGPLPATEMML